MADFKTEYTRPAGWRFVFNGTNVSSVPDSIPPDKYAGVLNARTNSGSSLRARPGLNPQYAPSGAPITDLIGITDLADPRPTIMWRDTNNAVYATGFLVTNLDNTVPCAGVSMLPFRPNQSPETWIYVAAASDYQKIQSPLGPAQKVGLMEPQIPCEAGVRSLLYTEFTSAAAWIPDGTVGGVVTSGNRTTDTAVAIFVDPAISDRWSVQVNSAVQYQIGETVLFNGATAAVVQDVLPQIAGGAVLQVQGFYNPTTNTTMMVPSQLPIGTTVNEAEFGQLRRGALIRLNGGTVYFVLNSVTGPNGTICFEIAGNVAVAPGSTISGVAAIIVSDIPGSVVGNPVTASKYSAPLTFVPGGATVEGTATFSLPLSTNPFANILGGVGVLPQLDDYVHLSVNISDPTQVIQIQILFNVDPVPNFLYNTYYYIVPTISDGISQWTEIAFPISALTFSGGSQNTSLLQCNAVQLVFTVAGSITVAWGSLWVGGGGQPDIGFDGSGAPYQYRIRARSTLTGARGNASPVMWYSVRPTRQNVIVPLPAAIEAQQDIWDVFRYGGSVLEYRYIGSGPPSTTFLDQYFDDAARAGDLLETDNFEPFPSIDIPVSSSGSGPSLGTGVAYGAYIILTGGNWPSNLARWLPGTLVQLAGNQAFTLRKRPQFLSPSQVLLSVEENVGYLASTGTVWVNEPKLARQICNIGWGPNEYGDFFFVGDTLRPGVVYFPKTNNPDSAPDTFNLELVQPSERLIGGACVGGLSFVSSAVQWWALYPSFNGPTRYSKRAVQVGRGLVSGLAVCSDGQNVFFWTKDGIGLHQGGPYKSLTDDLYVLFPHEGVMQGKNVVRAGVTFYAPDYSRCSTFRLSWANQYLFADYQDTTGTPRTLVCDLRTGGWCTDQYATQVTCHKNLVQPPGSLSTTPALYIGQAVGDTVGNVFQEQDQTTDNGTPIQVVVDTFEWDGGDPRSQPLFGDSYLDCFPTVPITVQPVSLGAPIGAPTIVPATNARAFADISLQGGELIKYLGLSITWSETYASGVTSIHLFQHSVSQQPETTTDRASDWTDCGTEGNKWFQGFLLNANTFGAPKSLMVQDSETDTLHAAQPTAVNHNGQEIIAYSFIQPFYSHLVRDVPQDAVPWQKFEITYIWQPAPESAQTWWTQATAFGNSGYQHVGRLEMAYAASMDVTLTITAQDGTSPVVLDLPANGGVYGKLMVLPTFNKGQSYTFTAQSNAPCQIYWNDCIAWVGTWGREGPYIPYRLLGGKFGDQAEV